MEGRDEGSLEPRFGLRILFTNSNVMRTLGFLVRAYPNDMDLGGAIRRLYYVLEKENEKIEKEKYESIKGS